LGGKKLQLAKDLAECPLKLVAFSNGPRIYVKQVLLALGLWDLFGEERLFAVDDVLPYCKPEEEAFRKIFEKVGCRAEECIMVEDSMKNVRRAKELGMKTVLITGNRSAQSESLRILPGDKPEINDLAVDIHMEVIEEFREKLGSLWEDPPVFRTS
jgi:FMN phosphatase YigB (HAD superfamily)